MADEKSIEAQAKEQKLLDEIADVLEGYGLSRTSATFVAQEILDLVRTSMN